LLGQGKTWLELPPTRSIAEALPLGGLGAELVGGDLLLSAELPTRPGIRRAAAL
jgi:hypothetical protein